MDVLLLMIELYTILCHCVLMMLQDIGHGKGKYYAVNFPLRDGIDDETYQSIFKPVSKHYYCYLLVHFSLSTLIIFVNEQEYYYYYYELCFFSVPM